ncbi:Smr/MutS family protein [Minwuia sp.]|uniref:Smr/MutS family protein n=1 Tax=Minwuia sp. TaxID=2493630 RepID=UPI003A8EE2B8
MTRNRGLSDDDRKLWSMITKQVAPLKSTEERMKAQARKAALEAARTVAAKPKPGTKASARPKNPARPARLLPVPPVMPDRAAPAAERRGRVAGVDRRTSEKLRKGQYPVDARLDLHGMTQHQAHDALRLFVRQCHAAGKRCLLVITGKGSRQRARDDGPYVNAEPPGVLKRNVPLWLKDRDLAPLVLSTAAATPGHGGSGAMYILLKRQRET